VIATLGQDSSIFKLKGRDVPEYIHRISTNRIRETGFMRTRLTIFTNEKGRIIDLCRYINLGEYQLLVGTISNREKFRRWIERFIVGDDVFVEDITEKYATIKLIGNCVERYIFARYAVDISESAPDEAIEFIYNNKKFLIIKGEKTGKYSEIIIVGSKEDILFLSTVLKLDGDENFPQIITGEEYNGLMIEMGKPGKNEIKDSFNPHEINLLNAVDFKKGCYIGQEVIARLDTYNKVQKSLIRIESDMETICDDALMILHNNIEIGKVTTLIKSPIDGKTKGLGVIRKEFNIDGATYETKGSDIEERSKITIKGEWREKT